MRRSAQAVLAVLCATLLFSTGCARFNDAVSQPFTTEPELKPGPTSTPPPPLPLPPKPFPKACPAPGVMQGCLESTSGLIMGSDSKTALVAERTTGAVKEVSVSAEPKVKMVIPVDPSGDGGLMDIVQSPTYSEDRLTYAYVSTPTDNRVIRIADGDIPKDILTGIPKGATGNTGSLIFTSPTTLVVQTGDAGNPALANDPRSLAGKVLRIEEPTTVNQAPQTTALSGMGSAGGMCIDPTDNSLYVTDRTPTADRLQRIAPDSKVTTVWTWPDRPGVAGCAALDGTVLVNLVNTKQTVAVRMAKGTGAVTGAPEVVRQDTHGHAWALQLSPDGNVWGATVNRTAGDPEKLDDVVFPLFPQGGGFPRSNADNT
jgi:glucose/arabinose dehydrogenase